MSLDSSPQIVPDRSSPDPAISQNHHSPAHQNDNEAAATAKQPPLTRSNRPSRACTLRAAQRLYAQQAAERKQKPAKKEQHQQQQEGNGESPLHQQQCSGSSKIITPLVGPPEPSQLPRWSLRSMWELASILNFLHVSLLLSCLNFSSFPSDV